MLVWKTYGEKEHFSSLTRHMEQYSLHVVLQQKVRRGSVKKKENMWRDQIETLLLLIKNFNFSPPALRWLIALKKHWHKSSVSIYSRHIYILI